MAEDFTAKFKVDISDLKKSISEANKEIKLANATFKSETSGMDQWSKNADGLGAKLKQLDSVLQAQKNVLASYQEQLKRQQQAYTENGNRAEQLRAKLQELAANGISKADAKYQAYESELKKVIQEQEKNAKACDDLKIKLLEQEGAVKQTESSIRHYTEAQKNLEKESTSLNNKIKQQSQDLEKLKAEYTEVAAAEGKDSENAKKLGSEIEKLSGELSKNQKAMSDAQKEADKLDKSLDESGKSAKESSDGFTVMKGALASLVADGIRQAINACKEFIAESIEVGKQFEKSISNVAALSGATGEEMQLLRNTAKEFGSSTQFSASQAADALGYMALAGWNAQQSASALGGVLDLAAASGMELAAASDMVTDYMSAFNIAADQSAYFADVLAYAQANANTTAAGLGEAFRNCAANMNAAGQDVETTTSLLAMMANQGLKGTKAGTALSAVMRDLTAKMVNGKIAIGKTSVTVMDAAGNYRDLTDILADVEKATGRLGDAEKASALSTTFTADSIKGLNLLLNAGVENAADFEKQLRKSTGTASKMAKVMNNNLNGDLTAFNSKIEGVKIQLYEKFEPVLRAGVSLLSSMADGVSYLIENFQILAPIIAGVAASLGVLASALIIEVLIKSVTAALAALNVTMMANPAIFLSAAIVGLVAALGVMIVTMNQTSAEEAALIEKTTKMREEADELAGSLNNTSESLKNLGSSTRESLLDIEAEADASRKLTDELFSLQNQADLTNAQKERMQQIVETLNRSYDGLNLAIDTETGRLNKSQEEIQKTIDKKYELAKANAMQELYTEQLKAVYKAEAEAATAAQKRAQAQAEIEKILASSEKTTKSYNGVRVVEYNTTKAQQKAIAELEKSIQEYDSALLNSQNAVEDSYNTTKNLASVYGEEIPSSLAKSEEASTQFFSNLKKSSDELAKEMVQEGKNFGQGYIDGIYLKIPDASAAGAAMAKAAKEGVANAQDSHSPSRVADKLGGWFGDGYNQGMRKKIGSVAATAKKLIDKVKTTFTNRNGLDINSHSSWSQKIGEYLCQGIVDGIKNKQDEAKKTVYSLITDTRTEVQKVMDGLNTALLESEKKYQVESERLKDSKDQKDKDYLESLKKIAEEERKIYDAEVKDAENAKQKIVDTYNQMVSEVFSEVEQVEKLQEDFRKKLEKETYLLQKVTFKMDSGDEEWYTLANLPQQTKKLEDFYDLLMQVKNRGNVPMEFFSMLREMSIEEATRTSQALMSASDQEFNQFFSDWERQREVEAKIAKDIYAEEAGNLAATISDKFNEISDNFLTIGANSADEFENGFTEKLRGVLGRIREQISNALSGLSYSGGSVVIRGGTSNQMAQGGVLKRGQIGFLEGSGSEAVVPLEKNKQWISSVARDMLQSLSGGISSTNNMTSEKITNFTQNIYAPKQPSRIELYRQTKNLLALAERGI